MANVKYDQGPTARPLPSKGEISIMESFDEARIARKAFVLKYVRNELKRMAELTTPYPNKDFIVSCEIKQRACIVSAQRYNIAESVLKESVAQDLAVIIQKADEARIAANMKSEKSRKAFFKQAFESYYGKGIEY